MPRLPESPISKPPDPGPASGSIDDIAVSTACDKSTSDDLIDPFSVGHFDLKPPQRLLRIVKSGERVPVTLRMTQKRVDVGLRLAIPPIGSTTTYLYGIEYDDASRGKHEGVYEGKQLFEPRQRGKGAGAFLLSTKDLRRGYTFAEALAERYDVDIPGVRRIRRGGDKKESTIEGEGITLGSTGIVVEAPGLEEVRKRMAQLRRLQSVGLEDYDVCGLGGDEDTKAFLRDNLTALTTLNLSNNLFTSWFEVAEITACIPSLRKIVLNNSRIERLSPTANFYKNEELIREALHNILEVELCSCMMSWDDVIMIAPFTPKTERLDLVDNTTLVSLEPMRTPNGVPIFLALRYLNLAGCGITDWTALAHIALLPKLETLDLSHTPLSQIPPRPANVPPIRLPSLIILSCDVQDWTSIDNLYHWIGDSLTSLKFSLSTSAPSELSTDPSLRIAVDQADARSIFIAKLPSLTVLNSSPVSVSERREAELAYVKTVDRLVADSKGKREEWGRYDELKRAHGVEDTGQQGVDLKLGHLRSRLYDLAVFTATPSGELHQTTIISILPSSPMALLRKKLHRGLKAQPEEEVRIWTVSERFVEGERGKAVEVPDGERVDWWFTDGDEVIVEV